MSHTNIVDLVEAVLSLGVDVPLTLAGDPVLRTAAPCYDGQLADDRLAALIDLMRAKLTVEGGVGLAAVQIGVPLRIAIIEDAAAVDDAVAQVRERRPLPFHALINPRLETAHGPEATHYEGCLSVPGYRAAVRRSTLITASWSSPDGSYRVEQITGWHARIIQHEVDHLDGILYLDRALTRSLSTEQTHAAKWNSPSPDGAASALGFDL